jgi:hypothetical protein
VYKNFTQLGGRADLLRSFIWSHVYLAQQYFTMDPTASVPSNFVQSLGKSAMEIRQAFQKEIMRPCTVFQWHASFGASWTSNDGHQLHNARHRSLTSTAH